MINNSDYLEAGGLSSCIQNSDRQAKYYIGRRTIKQSISLTSESIAPASLNQQLITPSLVQHLLVTAYPVQELNIQIRTHYPELNIQIRSHSSQPDNLFQNVPIYLKLGNLSPLMSKS